MQQTDSKIKWKTLLSFLYIFLLLQAHMKDRSIAGYKLLQMTLTTNEIEAMMIRSSRSNS